MKQLNFTICLVALFLKCTYALHQNCGGILTGRKGIINTPNFPQAFDTPIQCTWLISKSDADSNSSIIVYLTQVFVTSGLSFTEYIYYDDAYKAGANPVHTVSEGSSTHIKWLQVAGPFLEITLSLSRLEGHHLRALPALLDVFGFNITYEISATVKPYQCNTIECRFLGHCLASHDFSSYACHCFHGYSGKDCGEGPLCERRGQPTCQHGGKCRQMGAAAVSCDCPPGYTGDLCEMPILEPVGCEDDSCVLECPYDEDPANVCNCDATNSIIVTPDRTRYELVIKLLDRPKSLNQETKNQMTGFLKGLNISKDIQVTNISHDGEVHIQAWGASGEGLGTALQSALGRLPRLAGLRIQQGTPPRMRSEPALFLQTVAVNQRAVVWEGSEFILSCVAQGAPHMTFNWIKDGIIVNVTKATRSTWTRLVELEGGARWSMLLGVTSAASPDSGVFRCQASSRGRQQCRALRLHVLAPDVRLAPMSVTAKKGENVSLTCLSANSGGLHGKLGYSWTRNKALFPLAPGAEVWEDLVPAGSILHIYNIQKSGEYSCHVSSSVSARMRSVYVRAVEVAGGLCPAGRAWGLHWPATAPADHMQECPQGFSGHVTRICEMRNAPFESEWNIPDFSNCIADGLTDIYNQFQKLTFGYGNTTIVSILRRYFSWVSSRGGGLHPGEGGRLLRLARQALDFLKEDGDTAERQRAVEPFFNIVNTVLMSENGVLDQQGVGELQQGVVLGTVLSGGVTLRLSEISVHSITTHQAASAYRTEFPYHNASHSRWDKESIEIYLAPLDGKAALPDESYVIYIDYKNLTKYLTSLYYSAEVKEGTGLEYWLASRIVSVKVANKDGVTLALPAGKLSIRIQLHHSTPIIRANTEGQIVCGQYDGGWSTGSCEAKRTGSDITECACDNQGMYALLLARQTTKGGVSESSDSSNGTPQLLAGAVGGAALSVLLSGLLLLPAWLRRRCCLLYLKMHYCATTCTALTLMLYCITQDWCGNMSGGWLELLLLGGGAALVAQLLLLHAELAWPAPPPPHLPRTILMLMTGVCVLAALCSRAAGGSGWGLRTPSTPLTVFAAASALLAALHFLLCACVAARLRLLATKLPDRNNYIQKRMGLMRRSAAIFLCSKAVEVASVFHYNVPGPASSNALAATAALLGVMVFGCYILRDESAGGLQRLLHPKETDWDCSSDYVNTSLSFFIKQGGEAESRCAPAGVAGGEGAIPLAQAPTEHWRSAPPAAHIPDYRDRSMGKQADIVKSVEFKNIPPGMDSPERSSSSSVGAVSSVCDLVPSCGPPMPPAEPQNHQPQEYVTRVCVELGILSRTSIPPPEPPILLCSVDFEPYTEHKYEIKTMDTADNCVLCIGSKPKQESEMPSVQVIQAPMKSCLKNKDSHLSYCKDVILKESPMTESEDDSQMSSDQDTSTEKQVSEDHDASSEQGNMDGMLDLISHDLDYLLNRTAPPPPTSSVPGTSHSHVRQPSGDNKTFKVLDKIQEEAL